MSTAAITCMAANAQMPGSAGLQLKLEPGPEVRGVPASFVYTIVNASSHDISIPKPVVNCGDVIYGEIWIHVKFRSVGHTMTPEMERGCANDYMPGESALQRAERWPVLHPGDSISQTLPQAQLHYDAGKPGSYEVWAEYRPPYLSPQERQKLRKAGIDFPSGEMQTPHVNYRSKP